MLTWNPFISNEKYCSATRHSSRLIVNILLALSLLLVVNAGERVEILMSNVTTQEVGKKFSVTLFIVVEASFKKISFLFFQIQDDAYLCTSYKLEDDQKFISECH